MANDPDPKGVRYYRQVLGKAPARLTGLRVLTVNHLFANVWSRCDDQAGQE
jgi:hypothetical protein